MLGFVRAPWPMHGFNVAWQIPRRRHGLAPLYFKVKKDVTVDDRVCTSGSRAGPPVFDPTVICWLTVRILCRLLLSSNH